MPVSMEKSLRVLKKRWGHPGFWPYQEEVVQAANARRDVLAVLPTGAGKSAVYQIPACTHRGTAIVISPLIALMKDQVDDCVRRGIKATYLNSHVSPEEAYNRTEKMLGNYYKLVYCAPERIRNQEFLEAVAKIKVSFFVVDESHSISRWGHDFRPSYSRIHHLIDAYELANGERPSIIATTATATTTVVEDICASLRMDPETMVKVVADPTRENLRYQVAHPDFPWGYFKAIVRKWDLVDGRHIIYGNTRKSVESLATALNEAQEVDACAFYHAGMKPRERTEVQDAFKDGSKPVVCATIAFGMGIDVPNIRNVLLFGIPSTLEDYLQQVGRAGRDGGVSYVTMLVAGWSITFQNFLIDIAHPPWEAYTAVWDYLHQQGRAGFTKTGKIMALEIGDRFNVEISDRLVYGVLGRMDSLGLVERSSTPGVRAKTTRVRRAWGSTLADHVSRDNLAHEREAAQTRLRKLLDYCDLDTEEARRSYLRAYFLEPDSRPKSLLRQVGVS